MYSLERLLCTLKERSCFKGVGGDLNKFQVHTLDGNVRQETLRVNPCLSLFHRDCGEYVRYVFSVGPGAGSLLGFLAVIAFLPATVRCRKVGKSTELRRQLNRCPHFILFDSV